MTNLVDLQHAPKRVFIGNGDADLIDGTRNATMLSVRQRTLLDLECCHDGTKLELPGHAPCALFHLPVKGRQVNALNDSR
jgi:hypothetical protein